MSDVSKEMIVPPPDVPLEGLKKAVAIAEASAIGEWHMIVIEARHNAYAEMVRDRSRYHCQRYYQLANLEDAIIARGREVGVYPPKRPGKRRVGKI